MMIPFFQNGRRIRFEREARLIFGGPETNQNPDIQNLANEVHEQHKDLLEKHTELLSKANAWTQDMSKSAEGMRSTVEKMANERNKNMTPDQVKEYIAKTNASPGMRSAGIALALDAQSNKIVMTAGFYKETAALARASVETKQQKQKAEKDASDAGLAKVVAGLDTGSTLDLKDKLTASYAQLSPEGRTEAARVWSGTDGWAKQKMYQSIKSAAALARTPFGDSLLSHPMALLEPGRKTEAQQFAADVTAAMKKAPASDALSAEQISTLRTFGVELADKQPVKPQTKPTSAPSNTPAPADKEAPKTKSEADKGKPGETSPTPEEELEKQDNMTESQRISKSIKDAVDELKKPKGDKLTAVMTIMSGMSEYLVAAKDRTLGKTQIELGKAKAKKNQKNAPETAKNEPAKTPDAKNAAANAPTTKPQETTAKASDDPKDRERLTLEGYNSNKTTAEFIEEKKQTLAAREQLVSANKDVRDKAANEKASIEAKMNDASLTKDQRDALGKALQAADTALREADKRMQDGQRELDKAKADVATLEKMANELKENRKKVGDTIENVRKLKVAEATTPEEKTLWSKMLSPEAMSINQNDSFLLFLNDTGAGSALMNILGAKNPQELGLGSKPGNNYVISNPDAFTNAVLSLVGKNIDIKKTAEEISFENGRKFLDQNASDNNGKGVWRVLTGPLSDQPLFAFVEGKWQMQWRLTSTQWKPVEERKNEAHTWGLNINKEKNIMAYLEQQNARYSA